MFTLKFIRKDRVARLLVAVLAGTLFVPVGSFTVPQLLNQSQAGPITTSGLIFNLDANDVNSISGTSTTWKDLSGNGYDATLSSSGTGYTISNDTTNKAISFSNGTISSQNTGASATISKAIPSQTWSGFSASFSANMGNSTGGKNNWSRVFDFSAAGFSQGSGAKGGIFISRYEGRDSLHLGFWNLAVNAAGECQAMGILTNSNDAFAHYAVTVSSNGTCVWYKNGSRHTGYWSTGDGFSPTSDYTEVVFASMDMVDLTSGLQVISSGGSNYLQLTVPSGVTTGAITVNSPKGMAVGPTLTITP